MVLSCAKVSDSFTSRTKDRSNISNSESDVADDGEAMQLVTKKTPSQRLGSISVLSLTKMATLLIVILQCVGCVIKAFQLNGQIQTN